MQKMAAVVAMLVMGNMCLAAGITTIESMSSTPIPSFYAWNPSTNTIWGFGAGFITTLNTADDSKASGKYVHFVVVGHSSDNEQWPTGDWRPLAIDKFGQIGWVQQEGSGKTGRNSTIISAAGLGTALAFGQRCDTDCKNMNGIKAMQILATDQTNFYFSDVNVQITFKQMGRTFTNNGAVFLGFHYARASDWPDTIADSGAETGVATMSMMLQPPPCALQPENWYQWNGSDYGTAPINSLVPESSDDIDVNGSYPYVYATDVNAATQFLISVNDANAVIDMMPINFSNINGEFVSDYVLAVFDYKNRGTHYDSAENVYRCILVVENGQLFVMDGNDPPHRANLVDFALDSSVLWYDYDNLKAFCNAYMK